MGEPPQIDVQTTSSLFNLNTCKYMGPKVIIAHSESVCVCVCVCVCGYGNLGFSNCIPYIYIYVFLLPIASQMLGKGLPRLIAWETRVFKFPMVTRQHGELSL